MYKLLFMTQVQKDAKKLRASGLKDKALTLIEIIKTNPLQYPPDFIGVGVDLLLFSVQEFERRSQVPGTLPYWARKEGRVLHESLPTSTPIIACCCGHPALPMVP